MEKRFYAPKEVQVILGISQGHLYNLLKAGTIPSRKLIIGKTQKEVAKKGKEFLQGLKDGLLPDADKITVWQWLERWLTDYVQPNVRIKSFEKYKSCLKSYVKLKLGAVNIAKLKAPDVQRVFNDMLVTGGRKRQGVSSSYATLS